VSGRIRGVGPGFSQSLVRFFLRSRPVRASGIVVLASVALIMVLFIVLQSTRLSGGQQADQLVGRSDFLLSHVASVPLGTDGNSLDQELLSAIEDAGGTKPVVSYSAFELIPDKFPNVSLTLEENAWQSEPFPSRLTLEGGNWPGTVGEVAVSSSLVNYFPLGSTLEMFGGALTARVVGVVSDDFSRSSNLVLAPPGTWNHLSQLAPAEAARYDTSASVQLLWTGGDVDQVIADVNRVLGDVTVDDATALNELRAQLWSRGDLAKRSSDEPVELTLAYLIGAPLAGLLGASIAARFVNRIRSIMLSIGVSRRRTRNVGAGAVLLAVVGGASGGVLLGSAAGFAARPLIDALSDRALGPVRGIFGDALSLVGLALLGAVVGLLLLKSSIVKLKKSTRMYAGLNRFIPTFRQAAPALALALTFVGIAMAQSRGSTDQVLLGGIVIGFAVAILAPFALDLVTHRDPQALQALLAVRRLRSEKRSSGWVVTGIAALLLVSFSGTTLFYSAVATFNGQSESFVPPGQIQFEPNLDDEAANEKVIGELENLLGVAKPVMIYTADGGVDLMDGVTKVVERPDDLEVLISRSLSKEEQSLLESGGTLRTKDPQIKSVRFEGYDGATATLRALTVQGIDPSFRNFDGFVLVSTAKNIGVTFSHQTLLYSGVTTEQLAKAAEAPAMLGFNASWLNVYSPPEAITEPLAVRLTAATISVLAGLLIVFYTSSAARSLRPNLAGLRAIGVSRRWLAATLTIQSATLVVAAVLTAVIGSTIGIFAALGASELDIKFHLPWESIGITVAGLLIASSLGIVFATRRLSHVERMSTEQ